MLPPEKNRSDSLDSRQVDAVDVLVWEVYLLRWSISVANQFSEALSFPSVVSLILHLSFESRIEKKWLPAYRQGKFSKRQRRES